MDIKEMIEKDEGETDNKDFLFRSLDDAYCKIYNETCTLDRKTVVTSEKPVGLGEQLQFDFTHNVTAKVKNKLKNYFIYRYDGTGFHLAVQDRKGKWKLVENDNRYFSSVSYCLRTAFCEADDSYRGYITKTVPPLKKVRKTLRKGQRQMISFYPSWTPYPTSFIIRCFGKNKYTLSPYVFGMTDEDLDDGCMTFDLKNLLMMKQEAEG